jgi:hypothetical protein
MLAPEAVLASIHSVKTGLLFQAPWVIPGVIEDRLPPNVETLRKALFAIGMGCQVMDDMADLAMDLRMDRHNYVASLIRFGAGKQALPDRGSEGPGEDPELLLSFPEARKAACSRALAFLEQGFGLLLAEDHRFLAPSAIRFLKRRIRADLFFTEP